MSKGERHPMRTVIRLCAAILVALALTVAGYVVYLNVNYTRIADGIEVSNEGAEPKTAALAKGVTYTALTYNVGFGAYTPDFSFFMEEGTMKDGTPTQGEHDVAASKESVLACTEGDIATITAATADGAPDLVLLQEVDRDSTRSHHVDQCQAFKEALPTYGAFYAENFHCGYLLYPFPEFHGSVHGGLLTLSDVQGSAVRRSYPIDESFLARFFDLDRCFLAQRVAVEDGHELVVINSHMSAYDEGGVIRAQQMALVMGVLREYGKAIARETAAARYSSTGSKRPSVTQAFQMPSVMTSSVTMSASALTSSQALPMATLYQPSTNMDTSFIASPKTMTSE